MSKIKAKFKSNDKVVFSNIFTPNNLVMNVKRGTYKSSSMEMVVVELPGGVAKAYAPDLRLATEAEIRFGVRL